MGQYVLGIDVSKDTLDVVLLNEQSSQHKVFKNTANGMEHMQNWLISRSAGKVHACLEATGQYGEGVAECLYAAGHCVSVVNPARIKHYGQSKLHRNKTDKADAALIAEFCAREVPPAWSPLPPAIQQLRSLVRHLEDLDTMRQQEVNRIKSGEREPLVLEQLKAHIQYLDGLILETETAMYALIYQHVDLKQQFELLDTIKGIGPLTAAKLLAEIGDIRNFDNAPQLVAYAGLNPKRCQSGSSVRKKTKISKEGRANLRHILYMPGVVARSHNPIIRAFCDRLLERRLPGMAIIAAAMRKLLHQVFGVLKHLKPFDPNYLVQHASNP
jgi:transposase